MATSMTTSTIDKQLFGQQQVVKNHSPYGSNQAGSISDLATATLRHNGQQADEVAHTARPTKGKKRKFCPGAPRKKRMIDFTLNLQLERLAVGQSQSLRGKLDFDEARPAAKRQRT